MSWHKKSLHILKQVRGIFDWPKLVLDSDVVTWRDDWTIETQGCALSFGQGRPLLARPRDGKVLASQRLLRAEMGTFQILYEFVGAIFAHFGDSTVRDRMKRLQSPRHLPIRRTAVEFEIHLIEAGRCQSSVLRGESW
jgi:hypothetical protein